MCQRLNNKLVRQDACNLNVFESDQGVVCEYSMDAEKMGLQNCFTTVRYMEKR